MRQLLVAVLLIAAMGVLATTASARPLTDPAAAGKLDILYGRSGIVKSFIGYGRDAEEPLQRAIVMQDGRVVALAQTGLLARFTSHGRLDGRFGRRGRVAVQGADDFAVARDGSVVVTVYTGLDQDVQVVRLTPSGRRDPGFNGGRTLEISQPRAVGTATPALAPDGTIYLGFGLYTPYVSGPLQYGVVRVAPDGVLDTSFGNGGTAILPVTDSGWNPRLIRMGDGALRFIGELLRGRPVLAGVTTTGQPDTRLGPKGYRRLPLTITPAVLTRSGQGRLLLTGSAAGRAVVARLGEAGDADAAFGAGGVQRLSTAATTYPGEAATARGHVAVALTQRGSAHRSSHMAVQWLRSDGTPDRSIGRHGYLALSRPNRHAPAEADGAGFDRLGRLVLSGSTGDGLSDIRDDFGPDAVVLARLRSHGSAVRISRHWTLDARGHAHFRLLCTDRFLGECAGVVESRGAQGRFDTFDTNWQSRRLYLPVIHFHHGRALLFVHVTLRDPGLGYVEDEFGQVVVVTRHH